MLEYLKRFDSYELVPMGSSLKICLVAEGKADIYPRLGPTSEWDTAAAHAVVKAAGGVCVVYDESQKTELGDLQYNSKESLLNPFFIVKGVKSLG
jgi:3'(2'), 5'-bisphosphate nucleotidase